MSPEQTPALDANSPGPSPGTVQQEEIRDLLSRCQHGDQRAWSRVIQLHAGLVYSIARHHGLSEDRCDDVAQLVFTSLLKHVARIKDPVALPAWLAQTTRRACWRMVERIRRDETAQRAMEHTGLPGAAAWEDTDAGAQMLTRLEQAHAIRVALDELGGRCRELLRALFVDSGTPDYEAIGRRLGMPVGSIGPTRVRCLAKLAALLQHEQNPTEPNS